MSARARRPVPAALAVLAALVTSVAKTGCASGPAADAREVRVLAAGEAADVDRLKLAAVMIRDGHFDRAARELSQVDAAAEDLDRPRFHTLRGLVALHEGAGARAEEELGRAIALAGPAPEPLLYVYLAQARFSLSSWRGTLEALERAGAAALREPALHDVRARCHWALGERGAALADLARAEALFPARADLTRRRLLYVLEMGLFLEAAEVGRDYLARAGGTAEAHLVLGEALRRGRAPGAALEVLERGRLLHPGHDAIAVSLAHAYLDLGRPRLAARLLGALGAREARYLADAAELHRRAGELPRALALNAGLEDQPAKARQRLAILLDARRFEEAAALEPRLERLGLLEDDEVRFALAHIHARAGHAKRAEAHLARITRPDLFAAATELRRSLAAGGALHE